MDSFDLNIEHGVLVDSHLAVVIDPFCQFPLVCKFDSPPFGLEVSIVTEML